MDFIRYLAENRWHYLVVGLPFTIFLLIFYLRNKRAIGSGLLSIVMWAKKSMEVNGQASSEKLVIFSVLMLVYVPGRLKYIWTSFTLQEYNWESQMWGFGLDALVIAIANGWVTPKDLAEIRSGITSSKTTTTTTTQQNEQSNNNGASQ